MLGSNDFPRSTIRPTLESNQQEPLLTIIIPVYNAAGTIERTLRSLLRLAPENRACVEVVLVNDGCNDGSSTIIRATAERHHDWSWSIIDQSNQGLSGARNAALSAARGRWIFFLDADDELATDLVPCIRRHADASSIGLSVRYVLADGRVQKQVAPAHLSPKNWLDVLTAKNPYQPSSLLFKRNRLKACFDPTIEIVNDWMFWLSNPSLFEAMEIEPDITSAMIHIHGGNMSTAFAKAGINRSLVAERILQRHADELTRRQRNNLIIQKRIGRLQAGQRTAWPAFTRVPCSISLYGKLLVYAATSLVGVQATPYKGNSSTSA